MRIDVRQFEKEAALALGAASRPAPSRAWRLTHCTAVNIRTHELAVAAAALRAAQSSAPFRHRQLWAVALEPKGPQDLSGAVARARRRRVRQEP